MSLLAFAPSAVALDFARGEATIRGTLALLDGDPPPRVWFGTYFVHPETLEDGPGGSWSLNPLPHTDVYWGGFVEVEIEVVAGRESFHWWNNSDAPRAGYVAQVVAADSPESAVIPVGDRILDARDGIPVTCTG